MHACSFLMANLICFRPESELLIHESTIHVFFHYSIFCALLVLGYSAVLVLFLTEIMLHSPKSADRTLNLSDDGELGARAYIPENEWLEVHVPWSRDYCYESSKAQESAFMCLSFWVHVPWHKLCICSVAKLDASCFFNLSSTTIMEVRARCFVTCSLRYSLYIIFFLIKIRQVWWAICK